VVAKKRAKKRVLSKGHRKPRQIRYSDQEWAEITRAAELDGIHNSEVVRPSSLADARSRIERHQSRG